jgi:hypothetical protein
MQAMWRVYLVSVLLACVVAVVVAAGTAFITVRLLVPAPGESAKTVISAPAPTESEKSVILEGTAELRWGEELEVFYKRPFGSPPHLTFPGGLDGTCHIADQKATSFKIRRDNAGQAGNQFPNVKWKAEGQSAS